MFSLHKSKFPFISCLLDYRLNFEYVLLGIFQYELIRHLTIITVHVDLMTPAESITNLLTGAQPDNVDSAKNAFELCHTES